MSKSRRLKVLSMLTAIAVVAEPISVLAASDNGTLTVGRIPFSCGSPVQVGTLAGYFNGVTGSYSPTGLTGGETVSSVFDLNTPNISCQGISQVHISGFSSNPGSS